MCGSCAAKDYQSGVDLGVKSLAMHLSVDFLYALEFVDSWAFAESLAHFVLEKGIQKADVYNMYTMSSTSLMSAHLYMFRYA